MIAIKMIYPKRILCCKGICLLCFILLSIMGINPMSQLTNFCLQVKIPYANRLSCVVYKIPRNIRFHVLYHVIIPAIDYIPPLFCHFAQFITAMYIVDYSLMFSSSYILSFKLLRQLDIQHHGLYQVQILLAEPWKIDTSEIDMALLLQIEK